MKLPENTRALVAGAASLAFWWPCVFQSDFSSVSRLGMMEPVLRAVLCYAFPLALVVFSVLFTARRKSVAPPASSRVVLVGGMVGVVGYFLQLLSGTSSQVVAFSMSPVTFGAGVLCGTGSLLSAVYLFVYLHAFSRSARQLGSRAPAPVLFSFAACEVVQMLIGLIPAGCQAWFRVICPLVAALLLRRSLRHAAEALQEARSRRGDRQFACIVLLAALVLICLDQLLSHSLRSYFGFEQAFSREVSIPALTFALMMVGALFFLLPQVTCKNAILIDMMLLTVVNMIAFLVLVVTNRECIELVNALLLVASHCLCVFVFVVLGWAARQGACSDIASANLFVLLAIAIPLTLQNLFGSLANDALHGSEVAVMQIAGFALFSVSLLVIIVNVIAGRISERDRPSQSDWLRVHVADAMATYGLTPKELEVVIYAYRGYTSKKTAELLGITSATVDTHLKHIYRKAGFHARQELIDYIDSSLESS